MDKRTSGMLQKQRSSVSCIRSTRFQLLELEIIIEASDREVRFLGLLCEPASRAMASRGEKRTLRAPATPQACAVRSVCARGLRDKKSDSRPVTVLDSG